MATTTKALLIGSEYASHEAALLEVMESAVAVLGVPLCLHHYWPHCELPGPWTRHTNPICAQHQGRDLQACIAFCGYEGEVERMLDDRPDGYLHTCPSGCVKVAAPVTSDGVVVGALFAGPLPGGRNARVAPEHMVCLVSALALKLGRLLQPHDTTDPRRSQILQFVTANCEQPVTSTDLARALHLSPSRTSHVVRHLFGCSFTALLREARLAAAARCLRETNSPCSDIALRFRFHDQSHFTRCFKAQFRQSPLQYRRTHARRPVERKT